MITPSYGLTATERVLPRLALDFTTANLDSRVTVTRAAATATRINASGIIETVAADTPRFDFDPITLVCKGLLIEETRTNLYPYSKDFGDATWVPLDTSVVIDQATAPDGTLTADDLITAATTASHTIYRSTNVVSGSTYTYSIYVRSNDYTLIGLNFGSATFFGNNSVCYFDISNGTIRARPAYYTDARIVNAGNGWWRLSVSGPCISSGSTTAIRVYPAIVSGSSQTVSFDGAAFPGKITVWGAQLEAARFPTSYIPTEASQVTRNADNVAMTGTNFSDWYNQSEGSFMVDCSATMPIGASGISTFGVHLYADNTNRLRFNLDSGTNILLLSGRVDSDSSTRSYTFVTGIADGALYSGKGCFAYAAAIRPKGAVNGASAQSFITGNTGVVTGANILYLGSFTGAAEFSNGYIRKINYWPQALTNAEIQAFSK